MVLKYWKAEKRARGAAHRDQADHAADGPEGGGAHDAAGDGADGAADGEALRQGAQRRLVAGERFRHPVGATGARMAATLLRELDRRGGRYGLATLCIGGGQGLAAAFERWTDPA